MALFLALMTPVPFRQLLQNLRQAASEGQPPGPRGDSVTAGTPSTWAYQRLIPVDPSFQEGCHGKLLSVASAARPPAPAPAYLGWL